MANRTVEAFSVSHAAILNGTTRANSIVNSGSADLTPWGDVYGIREGSLEVDTDSYDNTGDNAVLSTWFWFNYATLTISGGYMPFELIQGLTGAVMTSSGAAPNDLYELPIWNDVSLNQPTRPVLIRCPSKDSAGTVRNLDIVLYKVQFQPISFDGPAYKDGLVVNYNGKALISSTYEDGTALPNQPGTTTPDRALGRLISRP